MSKRNGYSIAAKHRANAGAMIHSSTTRREEIEAALIDQLDMIPPKGEKHGECNRTACNNKNAFYFNSSTRMYYCTSCAHMINEASERFDNVTLCKLIN